MGKLFAGIVAVITVVSTAVFMARTWWLPPDISVLGAGIDRQINKTMVASGVLFVVSQLVLAAFVWRYGDHKDAKPVKPFPGGAAPMVVIATILVGAEILVLSLVGTRVWGGIFLSPPDPHSLRIDVQAEQFAYYFRYPGTDGKFEIVCTQLCGLGHYNMRAYLEVMTPDGYDQWLKDQAGQ